MKFIFYLLLISTTYAQDGSNASNTTTDGLSNTTNTTTTEPPLHSVTTTLGPTSSPTTTSSAPIETTTQTGTTTSFLRTTTVLIETTTVPPCSEVTGNSSCKVCLGPLCKFVERGEQGVGWEILFVAFGLTLVGFAGLCLYYICLRPLINGNPAEDIYWDDSDDEDEWSEAQPLNKGEIRRHSRERVRAFEIVDLNPVGEK